MQSEDGVNIPVHTHGDDVDMFTYDAQLHTKHV